MEALNTIFLKIRDIDSDVFLYGVAGSVLIVLGGFILNGAPPNYTVGYPSVAIGFALYIYAVSIKNAKMTSKKMDQILEKLTIVQEEMSRMNSPK